MSFEWHKNSDPPYIKSHSLAKLRVLGGYLDSYFDTLLNSIRGSDLFKLDIVDGFCGGGLYQSDNGLVEGSPIVMLERAIAASVRHNAIRSKEIQFDLKYYFVDNKKAHIDYLNMVLNERGFPPALHNINIINENFKNSLDGIIKSILRRHPRSGRSIFLLDQKGYSTVPLELVKKILSKLPNAEVILTFSVDTLINFAKNSSNYLRGIKPLNLSVQMVDRLISNDGDKRKGYLQRRLLEDVQRITGARFYTPFFITPKKSRRSLWFLHLSNHPKARDVMLQTHWNQKNTFVHYGEGDLNILGYDSLFDPSSIPLFRFDQEDEVRLREGLIEKIPTSLYELASEGTLSVYDYHSHYANGSAARFKDFDFTVIQLARMADLQIISEEGSIRHPDRLKILRPSDRIVRPSVPIFTGLDHI